MVVLQSLFEQANQINKLQGFGKLAEAHFETYTKQAGFRNVIKRIS